MLKEKTRTPRQPRSQMPYSNTYGFLGNRDLLGNQDLRVLRPRNLRDFRLVVAGLQITHSECFVVLRSLFLAPVRIAKAEIVI